MPVTNNRIRHFSRSMPVDWQLIQSDLVAKRQLDAGNAESAFWTYLKLHPEYHSENGLFELGF